MTSPVSSETTMTPPTAWSPKGTVGHQFYAWYVLAVLVLVHSFNAVDRALISILVEPIRLEFGFSDGEVGLLSGVGFAIFYALFGIPVARLADRSNRRSILAAGLALWSGMTALTGYATGFGSMLAARIGVGVGEATCYPTAYPLIGDYFAPVRRPKAFALFQAGAFIGIVLGAVIAGKVAEAHGWRAAFHVIGVPGVVLALLVLSTVREPLRGISEGTHGFSAGPGFWPAIRRLLTDRAFLLVVLAVTALSSTQAIAANWGSALLMRLYHVSQGDVGLVAGPVVGLGGVVGTIAGGFAASTLTRKRGLLRAGLLVPLATIALAPLALVLFCFGPTLPLVLIGGGMGAFLIGTHTGPAIAVGIGLVSPENRGVASSLLVLGQSLVGFGFGPTLVGFLSDALQPHFGIDSLRYAMLAAPVCVVLGWISLLLAYRAIGQLPALKPAND